MSDATTVGNKTQLEEAIATLDSISQKLDSSGHTADAEVVLGVVEELLDHSIPLAVS